MKVKGSIERRKVVEANNDQLLDLGFDRSSINEMTGKIYDRIVDGPVLIKEGNFTSVSSSDIKMMFELYDEIFFDDFFKLHYPKRIKFSLSRRMTRSGGKTEYHPRKIIIKLSTPLLFQSFNGEGRDVIICGIVCSDRLEAMMRIMEHEIIHLIEYVSYGGSSCSGNRFLSLVSRIFGHTDTGHQLVTGQEIADKNYGLMVGDRVSFEFQGDIKQGQITRITNRVTVMVKDCKGFYHDLSGKRYTKYYIPLNHLEPLNKTS